MADNDKIITAAIGRVAYIGALYDARSGNFCGSNLFKNTPPTSAVKEIDNPSMETQFLLSDTFEEKFSKLDVEAELKISVLAGLFKLEGHGSYLNDIKKSKRAVRSALLHNIKTKHEQLNLFNQELKECFSMDAVNLDCATHVVTEVSWGANALVTMEYSNLENRDTTEIKGDLKAALKKIAFSIEGKANIGYATDDITKDKQISFKTFADVLPSDDNLPQTVEEVLAFMKKIPQLVKMSNNGKGKPIQYTMVPLSIVQKYLHISHSADYLLKQLDEQAVVRFVHFFDEISSKKQELNDLYNDMNINKFCISLDELKDVHQKKNELEAMEANLKTKLANTLKAVRAGKQDAEQLEALLNDEIEAFSSQNIDDVIKKYMPTIEKIAFVNVLKKEGVSYIGHGHSIDLEKLKVDRGDIFILYFGKQLDQSEKENRRGNIEYFLGLVRQANNKEMSDQSAAMQKAKYHFLAVDIDVHPEIVTSEGVNDGTRICHYKNGEYIDMDVLLSETTKEAMCYAKSLQKTEQVFYKPNKRAVLELRCPCACKPVDHSWICVECSELIEYGFDEFFYCQCGKAPAKSFTFKCNSEKHGLNFCSMPENILMEQLHKIRPMKEMNLLILGETGVGKSTFINALANYMTYPSLEEAENNELISLIPTKFTMLNDKYEECQIITGNDKNEAGAPGASSTQDPKAYTFESRQTLIRIIDTPGIGDTRGYEVDKKNTNKILKFISNFDEIHGILILLKPNNARLTVLFRFCIKELLTHLHRSASQNIVFCFTNARSTFYRPGDTFPALKKLLAENKDIEIALSKHTMYCFDNESFRFLCITHHGNKYGIDMEAERQNYSESWKTSVTEINRMFDHIVSLKPHTIKDTLSLNDARRVIVQLTRPMADISKNIQDNIEVVKRKQVEIENSKLNDEELAKKLHIPAIDLVRKNLSYPRTVCTSLKCVKHHKNTDGTVWTEYVTICHSPCGLTGIPPEHYPHEGLRRCSAMNSSHNCNKCGCCYDQHTHLTYEQIRVNKTVEDQSVVSSLNASKTAQEKIQQFVKSSEDRIKQLEYEQNFITKTSAKFGFFLKTYAISPYNDALAEYLDHQIREEKDKFEISKDRTILDQLERNRHAYDTEVRILEEAIKSNQQSEKIGPEEIDKLVKELYKLKINGEQIKQQMEQALEAETNAKTYFEVAYKPKSFKNQKLGSKWIGEAKEQAAKFKKWIGF